MNKKILILGFGGSGKTFLAKRISQKLNISKLHLDEVFWKEDKTKRETSYFEQIIRSFLESSKSSWNYRWIL
jgi:adenylate kinase family enzyme